MSIYEKNRICCFTGYRAQKLPWRYNETAPECLLLKAAIADNLAVAYESGFRHFICGMSTGVDTYFGEAVIALREEHPDVFLEAAVPFPGQENRWPSVQRERYARLAVECDEVTILRSEYAPGCMMARNRYMVDRSSLLIAVYDGRRGGTYNTVHYAERVRCTTVVLPVTGYDNTPRFSAALNNAIVT